MITNPRLLETDISYVKVNGSDGSSIATSTFYNSFDTAFSDLFYFNSDDRLLSRQKNANKQANSKSFDKIHEIDINFHPYQFLEVLLCRCLHNMILGPLSLPILFVFYPKTFLYNMRFLPQKSVFYFEQIATWLLLMCYFALAYFRRPNDDNSQPCTHLMGTILLMNITLKQIIVSLQYAYYTTQKYKFLKANKVSAEIIMKDNSFHYWWDPKNSEISLREMYSAIRRLEIELSLFYMDFIVKADEKTETRLKELSEQVKEKIYAYADSEELGYSCHLSERKATMELSNNRYFGGALFYDMIATSRTTARESIVHCFKLLLVLSIFGSIMQSLMGVKNSAGSVSVFVGWNFPTDQYNWVLVSVYWIINTNTAFYNMLSFSYGIVASKIRCNMMRQLNYMITPRKKVYNEGIQKYPTINLFDPISLKTWCCLKRIVIEYGKKYQKRTENGVSFQLLFYFLYMLVLIYQLFVTQEDFYDYRALVIVWYQLGLVIWLTGYLMTIVAQTNEIYQVMKGHAKEIRDILSDFIHVKIDYLQKDKMPRNLLYQLFYKKLRSEFGHQDKSAFVQASTKYLKNLTACFDDILLVIAHDQRNYPARALEVPFTSSLLKRVTIGILSLSFSVMTYFIHKLALNSHRNH